MFIGNFTQKAYIEKMLGGTIMSEINLSAEVYYEKAKRCLEKKDLINFLTNIGITEVLADSSMIGKVKFLKVKGLFDMKQFKEALEFIPNAIQYSEKLNLVKLLNYEGAIKMRLGEYVRAKNIFKDIIEDINESSFLTEVYLNLIFVNLTIYKTEQNESILLETKKYLDLANEYFNHISSNAKGILNQNYSVYYFYKEDYEKAIQILLDTIPLIDEKNLANIYNNLAEIYLKINEDGVCDLVEKYTHLAEVIGTKYDDDLALAKAFYTKAMAELQEDQLFRALDTLYLSLEYFKKAEAYPFAFDCIVKINEIINEYKMESLTTLKDTLKNEFKGTAFYQKL